MCLGDSSRSGSSMFFFYLFSVFFCLKTFSVWLWVASQWRGDFRQSRQSFPVGRFFANERPLTRHRLRLEPSQYVWKDGRLQADRTDGPIGFFRPPNITIFRCAPDPHSFFFSQFSSPELTFCWSTSDAGDPLLLVHQVLNTKSLLTSGVVLFTYMN